MYNYLNICYVPQEAGNRYVIFNNNGSPEANANQVGQLLETIKFMVLNNEGQCYTSPLLTVVEDYMKERESQVFSQLYGGSARRPRSETGYIMSSIDKSRTSETYRHLMLDNRCKRKICLFYMKGNW